MARPIKKHLQKKAVAKKYYSENEFLVYEIELINFWVSPRNLCAQFIHGDNESDLSIESDGSIIFVRVPVENLRGINEVAYIDLKINNKSVWITKSTRWDNFCESILIEKKYITTNINKRIIIANHFKELTFIPELIPTTVVSTHYNSLALTFDNTAVIPDLNQLEIYAFNHDKFVILNGVREASSSDIVIADFQPLLTGLWRLFLKMNEAFYPLEMSNDSSWQFDTYNHDVSMLVKGD